MIILNCNMLITKIYSKYTGLSEYNSIFSECKRKINTVVTNNLNHYLNRIVNSLPI